MKRGLSWLAALTLLAGVGYGGWYGVARYREQALPAQAALAPVRFGEFLEVVRCRGELKADRFSQIYVPFIPNLQIAWIAPSGEMVHQGDPVIRYEQSGGEQDLISAQANLEQVKAQLEQAKAQVTIDAQHDEADIQDGKYQVELARIKTATNEFVSRIEAEGNSIDLATAEQKLRQTQAFVNQHKVADQARVTSIERQVEQSQTFVDLIKDRVNHMETLAPLTGYWIVNQNNQGTSSQPYKVGDSVSAAVNVAVIPDMASLMMDGKVEEIDRGRIQPGADVRVRVDAVPDLVIHAKLTQISPLAELSLEDSVARNFRGYAALPNPDARLRPGMNASMDIINNRIAEATSVPAKALFTKAGKPVVYLSEAGHLREVEVEILARNPDEIAVKGVPQDAMVSLVDPTTKDKNATKDSGSTAK